MAEDDSERTEAPSGKRRDDARKRGQVVHSREITSAALLLGAAWGLSKMGSDIIQGSQGVITRSWSSFSTAPMTSEGLYHLLILSVKDSLMIIVPIILLLTVVAVMSVVVQHGWLWTTEPLEPKWSRVDPLAGLGRIFSARAAVELVKTILKVLALGWVLYLSVRDEIPQILVSLQNEPTQLLSIGGAMLFRLVLTVSLVVGLISVGDYGYQWWENEKGLRMSRKELKDEAKDMDGNPLIKARIRSIQREMARKRMMAEVPKAEVIITNPTHLSVALMYKPEKAAAPVVVAKGAGFIAQTIREIANEHNIPIIENKPLARELFKTVKIGEAIPSTLYRAVAEVLAYVFRLRGKTP